MSAEPSYERASWTIPSDVLEAVRRHAPRGRCRRTSPTLSGVNSNATNWPNSSMRWSMSPVHLMMPLFVVTRTRCGD